MTISPEEQELMEKIARVAGQINQHKNQQAGLVPPQSSHALSHHRTSVESRNSNRAGIDGREDSGYSGSWRHQRGGYPYPSRAHHAKPVHRHRTLVLNGASQQGKAGQPSSGATSDSSTSSWVAKNDRHRQIINSSIYQKEAQARTRAIEQTLRQKQQQRDDLERTKLISHLHRAGNRSAAVPNQYELTVQGIRFAVTKNGSKLVKIPGDLNSGPTPKMAIVGGVKFYRSKNGNLYRHGIVKAQRQSGAVKKVNVPCRNFSMTGSCTKGPRCRYIHDPAKVAVCKDFLQQGECINGDSCDLSHELSAERTPTCLHFIKDSCTKPDCKFTHAKVSPAAPVCRQFGLYGYCEKGGSCTDRHVFECPDFSNTGVCNTKGCKLPHRERASVLRRANARDDAEMEDLSSDDESVDSDDVDSDEVDEFVGQDDDPDLDFAEQKDFIQF
ncbi:hypothetical protein QBC32DRAFT_342469 [Pseudoneurospora amorphoporcata]|uniref:C3H1-type domain-containing protein n=1 Tax=Pseudoneurospora amorphoporcata TaxID=241081 RepID=A0AAN6NU25_9PEZI|nr:hypothetical protein QBC32DRAFT_342469 [Pseudoneurospora amorphoporcata]